MKSTVLFTLLLVALPTDGPAQVPPTQSYQIKVFPGYNSVANHLDFCGNTLDHIFPQVPEGTLLYKFNSATQRYGVPAQFFPGVGWLSNDPFLLSLNPGEGAFMLNPTRTEIDLTLTGEPRQPRPRLDATAGYNLVSCQTTQNCKFEELLGFPPQAGDVVYKFDRPFTSSVSNITQAASSVHTFGVNGWDTVPQLAMGKAAFVFLADAPRIIQQPEDRTAVAGADVVFTVGVIGAEPLHFQWRFRGADIEGETNSILVLVNVQPEDTGYYSVVVKNMAGVAASERALLRVIVPVAIIEQPQSMMAVAGDNVLFKVAAEGTGPLRYQWFFYGAPIAGATNDTLELPGVKAADAGDFVVLVANFFNAVTSKPARLAVNFPPVIVIQPLSQVADLNGTVTFSVEAVGTQPLFYQWLLNGVNIPGANGPTLTLTGVQPSQAGSYQVTVANVAGATSSIPALLKLNIPILPLMDDFAASVVVQDRVRIGSSSNVGATPELGEPKHVDKAGGKSMWITWVTAVPGIVTFRTMGSSFDTLLAAYTGNTVSNLTEVASDEDSGRFHTSEMSFNAAPNTLYHIVVDGLFGAAGDIVLSWTFEPTPDLLPEILVQPKSQAAALLSDVTFTVLAKTNNYTYQWFFKRREISGATQPTLTLRNVQETNAGAYFVRLSRGTRFIDSRTAFLEFSLVGPDNEVQDVLTADKFADVVMRSGGSATSPPDFAPARNPSTTPVLGYTGTQLFDTDGATKDEGEPNHCGIPGGASHWFSYTAPANGRLFLNTEGSNFDTVLAVYGGSGQSYASLIPVACDNNHGANGLTSRLDFQATAGVTNWIAVDGVNAATGLVHLNYRLLVPLVLSRPAKTNSSSFQFRVTATPGYNFTLQRSSNCVTWTAALTTNSLTGVYDFRDTNAPSSGRRFYRATQNP